MISYAHHIRETILIFRVKEVVTIRKIINFLLIAQFLFVLSMAFFISHRIAIHVFYLIAIIEISLAIIFVIRKNEKDMVSAFLMIFLISVLEAVYYITKIM